LTRLYVVVTRYVRSRNSSKYEYSLSWYKISMVDVYNANISIVCKEYALNE
jgi:hypothetical protein